MMFLLLSAAVWSRESAGQSLTYPATRRDSVVEDYYGTKVADPYRWLEELDSPSTADWVKAQSRLTFDYLGRLPEREVMRERLTALWNYVGQTCRGVKPAGSSIWRTAGSSTS